jgi:Cellulase (glycosyl hydrolase family 5)/Invasin, domain 3
MSHMPAKHAAQDRPRLVRRLTLAAATLLCVSTPVLTAAPTQAASLNTATLTLSRHTVVPGQTVYATVTAFIAANRPANNVQAAFSSNGDLSFAPAGCSTNSSGQCTVAVTGHNGYGQWTVSVNVTGIGYAASATAPLTEYDAPASMGLGLAPSSLQADGISATTATATLLDSAGRPVAGEPVTVLSNDPGMLVVGAVSDNGDGTYSVRVDAPPPNAAATGPFTDTVTATASLAGLSAAQSLTLTNPPKRLTGPLSVSGTQILDGTGNAVTLHGLDAVSFYASPSDPMTLTPMTVGNLYRWGANDVRVMMSSDLYLHNCANVSYPPNYDQAFDDEINLITSYGMLAVIDLHASNPTCAQPQANGLYGSATLGLPPQADAQALFTQLTATFGANPLVGYELYNEPHACFDPTTGEDVNSFGQNCTQANLDSAWLNGGTYLDTASAKTYAAAGMPSLYDTVRQGAPSSLVFVDANGYASDNHSFDNVCQTAGGATCAWENPTNMVYVFHYYDCQDTTSSTSTTSNQQATCEDGTPETCATITARLGYDFVDHAHNAPWPAPIDLNEFGWPQNEAKYQYAKKVLNQSVETTFTAYNHGLFINNVIATLQAHGASWSAFAYGNQHPGQNVWQGPYTLVGSADTVPWTANPDGQSTINGMAGPLTCQDPPAGDG